MNILEKDIEDLVFDSLKLNKKDLLIKRGFWSLNKYEIFDRQLDLGSYGRLDMIGIGYNRHHQEIGSKKTLKIGVFELKKAEINLSTYMQAARYCKGLQRLVEDQFPDYFLEFEVILIGTSIDTKAEGFIYLPDLISNLSIYTVKLDLENGITFKSESGYKLSNEIIPKAKCGLLKNIKSLLLSQTKNYVYQDLDDLPF